MLQQHRLPTVLSQCCVPSHCGMLCVQSSTLVCRMHMSVVSGHLSGDCRRNNVRNISATLVCQMHMSGVFDHLSGDCRRNKVRNINARAQTICRLIAVFPLPLMFLFVECICQGFLTTFRETVDGIQFATSVHAHKPYAG